MTVELDIAALREAVGARTDMELAEKLGIKRAAVSLWRSRGAIPQKYRLLYKSPSQKEIRAAVENAVRFQVFGNPNHSYWLMAALAVLPAETFKLTDEYSDSRGERLERIITKVMSLSVNVTLTDLQKQYCENRDDYEKLVYIIKENYMNYIDQICSSNAEGDA